MNNGAAIAIGFVAGAAAGAGTAYYFTRKYFTTLTCDIASELVEQRLKELEEAGIIQYLDAEDEEEPEDEDDDDSPLKTVSSLSKEYVGDPTTAIDYSQFYNKKDPEQIMAERQHPMDDNEYPSDISDEERAELDGEQISAEYEGDKELHKRPYAISPDQFAEEHPEYDKESIYAYSDGVMTHENDEIVDDVDTLLGDVDTQPKYGGDTVYIRNDRFSTDYEVMYVETTYQEAVEGASSPNWAD